MSFKPTDRVHYTPTNMQAESPEITPIWEVIHSNTDFTIVKHANVDILTEIFTAATDDFTATTKAEEKTIADKAEADAV